METNTKIQKSTFNTIKKIDKKIFDKIEFDKFIKILEINNKKLSSFNIFSLYANYNKSSSKNISPIKYYFNYWHKSLNNKKDE